LSYERWDFADFGGFWYKSGGRTTGVGVQAGNRLRPKQKASTGWFSGTTESDHTTSNYELLHSFEVAMAPPWPGESESKFDARSAGLL
jgi:hypothetical protein